MDLRTMLTEAWEAGRGGALEVGGRLCAAILIAVAGRVVVLLSRRLINRAVASRLKFDENLGSILKVVVTYGAIILCGIMILEALGINTSSLVAVLATAGVAVALALKDTLSNIAAGIMLLLHRLYRRGDFIEFGSYMGTVKEMDLFNTTLETIDGIYVSAPNSAIWGAPLKNYTRNGRRRMELILCVAYNAPLDAAFDLLRRVAEEEKRFLPDPPPQVMVQSLGDSAVNVMLRAWAPVDIYWDLYWDQMRNIKERADAAGLYKPLPQREITIRRT